MDTPDDVLCGYAEPGGWGEGGVGRGKERGRKRGVALCLGPRVVVCEVETGKGKPSAIAREIYKEHYAQKGGLYFLGYVG